MLQFFSSNKMVIAVAFALAASGALMYYPALALNFYGDDYSFVEQAGRSTLGQYLAFYFDPRAQTGWYRPMQGVLFGIEWLLFGGNPLGYHAVNVFVHLCNAFLLFAILSRVDALSFNKGKRSDGWVFLAVLIWMGLPLYGVAVFWPGDADFQMTFFYLAAILFWLVYLQKKEKRWQLLSFSSFVLALTTKEFGVTIPVTLFLLDRFILRDKTTLRALILRYAPFLIVYAMYLPLELYIQSRSVLTNEFGYGIGVHVARNFIAYLAAVAFPWSLPEPISFLWLAIAAITLICYSLARKTITPLILVVIAIISYIPVTPFPWFFQRYLYSATMISAVVLAWLANALLNHFQSRWVKLAAAGAIALVVFVNGLGVATAAADFAEIGRQTRVPFRDFTQRHSTLPTDTLVYFINPPTITSQLSGMFFLRYGADVQVASDDQAVRANLREHQAAYVIYFDEQKRTREIAVVKNISAKSNSPSPQRIGGATLKDWELTSDRIKRGEAIALILYWDAPTEATVGLVENATDQAITRSSGRTHGVVADARILPIPLESRTGIYRVEITAAGAAQKFSIAPIAVIE